VPVHCIYAKVAREVIRDWTVRKYEEHCQSIGGQKQVRGCLKKTFFKKSWRIVQPEQKPAKNNDRFPNRTLTFKKTLFKLWLVNSPECD
jgi:hypothetical protein